MSTSEPEKSLASLVCSSPECDRPASSRGMCHPHYKRWLRDGKEPVGPVRKLHERTYTPLCSIEDCERPHCARGYCTKHYRRLQVHGDPLHPGRDWDGKCKRCESAGPFYGRSRTCKRCSDADRKAWRDANPERAREISRVAASRGHARRRQAALDAYGAKCTCCGETEAAFLAIDHIDGGGNAHRRSLSADGSIVGSSNFYRWLERAGWPEGFQVLCHNCNFAKSHGGCPHGNC